MKKVKFCKEDAFFIDGKHVKRVIVESRMNLNAIRRFRAQLSPSMEGKRGTTDHSFPSNIPHKLIQKRTEKTQLQALAQLKMPRLKRNPFVNFGWTSPVTIFLEKRMNTGVLI